MRRSVIVAASAGLLLAVSACAASNAQSGPVESRTFAAREFSAIELGGPYHVTVTTGQSAGVTAQGPRDGLDSMQVEVRGGKLVIGSRNGWSQMGRENKVRVQVTVPALRSAAVTSAGQLSIDQVSGDSFAGATTSSGSLQLGEAAVRSLKVSTAGSGGIEVGRVRGEQIEGGAAGSGGLRLEQVEVRKLDLGLASSGSVEVAGRADQVRYGVAGSGSLDASNLTATAAEVGVAGSGSVRARVTGSATVATTGSGSVDITGGATCQQSRQGSGSIRCS
jgi:hypothetical protein